MTYFEKLFKEKEIDLDTEIKIDGHINFTVKNVLEFINSCPKSINNKIRNTYMRIDFKNGDIMDFTKYIAKGIVKI